MTKKFQRGFLKNDIILKETNRYCEVQNGYQKFIVGDNGERRLFYIQFGNKIIDNKVLTGNLSLKNIKHV